MKASPEVESFFATGKQNFYFNIKFLVIVIAYFATAFSAFKDSWEMVIKKAKKWLSKESKTLNLAVADFENAASKLLKEQKLI